MIRREGFNWIDFDFEGQNQKNRLFCGDNTCSMRYVFIGLFILYSFFGVSQERMIPKFADVQKDSVSAEEFTSFLQGVIDSLDVPALSIAVASRGELVYLCAMGKKNDAEDGRCKEETLFEAASLTKPFFAVLVHQLAEESFIDLDQPLYTYLPNKDLENDPRYKKITARMILSHTSGLPNWRKDSLSLQANPGETYIYSGEGYEYLGQVVEKVMNRELAEVFYQRLLKPLGMKTSFFAENEYLEKHIATGYIQGEPQDRIVADEAHPAYGLRTNARDYIKFILFISQSELFNELKVVQKEVKPGLSVCQGIFRKDSELDPVFYHTGNNGDGFTARFEIDPKQKFSYVYFINTNKEKEFSEALNAYFHQ